MDEPLSFAHYYDKKNACRYSIAETARRVAASIAEIRQFYSNVKVVDVEAPNITNPQQWNADFPQWLAAYRQATGTPLDAGRVRCRLALAVDELGRAEHGRPSSKQRARRNHH